MCNPDSQRRPVIYPEVKAKQIAKHIAKQIVLLEGNRVLAIACKRKNSTATGPCRKFKTISKSSKFKQQK